MDDIHTDKKYYYVSVIDIDANRHGLLLGPYPTHQEALDNVKRARELAYKADPRSHFYGFGTAGSDELFTTVFGK